MEGHINTVRDCAFARAVHSRVENDTPAMQRMPAPCFTDDKFCSRTGIVSVQPAGTRAAAQRCLTCFGSPSCLWEADAHVKRLDLVQRASAHPSSRSNTGLVFCPS